MSRRGVAWLVSFACAAVGGLLAHALTYRLLAGGQGLAGPLHSGHAHHDHGGARGGRAGRLALARSALRSAAACSSSRSWRRSSSACGPGRRRALPLWLFALVPPGRLLAPGAPRVAPRSADRVPYLAALGTSLVGRHPAPDSLRARRVRRGTHPPRARRRASSSGLRARPRVRLVPLAIGDAARAARLAPATALPPRARLRPARASARRALAATKRKTPKEESRCTSASCCAP